MLCFYGLNKKSELWTQIPHDLKVVRQSQPSVHIEWSSMDPENWAINHDVVTISKFLFKEKLDYVFPIPQAEKTENIKPGSN